MILAKPSDGPGALWMAAGPCPGAYKAWQRTWGTLEGCSPLRLRAKPGMALGSLERSRALPASQQSPEKAPGLSGEKQNLSQAPAEAWQKPQVSL